MDFHVGVDQNLYFTQQRFEAIIRGTMVHLWESDRKGILFKRLTIGLLESNALGIVLQTPALSPSLSGFIAILSLIPIDMGHPSDVSYQTAWSIYYWSNGFEARSMSVITRLDIDSVLTIAHAIDIDDWWFIDPIPENRQKYFNALMHLQSEQEAPRL